MVRYEWGACTAVKSKKKIISYQTDLWIFLYNMHCKLLINNLRVAWTYFSCICMFIWYDSHLRFHWNLSKYFPTIIYLLGVFSFTKIEILEFVRPWSRNFCNDSYRKIYRSCLSFTCVTNDLGFVFYYPQISWPLLLLFLGGKKL